MARSSQRRLTHNIGVLYGLQAVRYVTPLVLVPYLASTLGVATWGVLSLAQGLALYLGTLVEYSFPAMGTRTVAALREDRARLQQVLADVTAAKGLLGTVSLGLALALALGVPEVRAAAGLFGGCAAVAVLQAAAPYWFLNGLERMRLVAGITTAERALGLGLILVLVREPADVWKVPAVQAVLAAGALAAGYGIVGRAYPIRGMSWRRAAGVLRQGWPLFTSVLAVRGMRPRAWCCSGCSPRRRRPGCMRRRRKSCVPVRACCSPSRRPSIRVWPTSCGRDWRRDGR
ncbi:hypothetical protein AWN76_009300 [Rhodothermaceae bacterium RA]|nr:hypothetical protein AWN76_009300 [Rhodothermaceae bacterium RA]